MGFCSRRYRACFQLTWVFSGRRCGRSGRPAPTGPRETWLRSGVTLIELLVVLVILGILAAVATLGINDRAKTNACKAEVSTVEAAYAAYVTENDGAAPANLTVLQAATNSNLKESLKYVDNVSSTGAIFVRFDAPCSAKS